MENQKLQEELMEGIEIMWMNREMMNMEQSVRLLGFSLSCELVMNDNERKET